MIKAFTNEAPITSMNTGRKVIICGKGASGKDYLRKYFEDNGFKYGISMTTRPKRDNEVNGADYNFVTTEQFDDALSKNLLKEHIVFNKWKYGLPFEEWNGKNLFILTPSGISNLTKEEIDAVYIIYLAINESVRRNRLNERHDADGIERRISADDKDFQNFSTFDKLITNHNYNPSRVLKSVLQEMELEDMYKNNQIKNSTE
jgi:guanylate kinase